MFLDGSSLGTATITPYTGANNFRIGTSNSIATYFDGTLANVKLTDIATPANSLVFYLDEATQNYEFPVSNVFGSDLVTNGTFDTDTTGWYSFDNGVVTGGILSVVGETLRITNDATGTNYGLATQNITTVIGDVYMLDGDRISGTGLGHIHVGTTNSATTILANETSFPLFFTATNTTTTRNTSSICYKNYRF